MICKYEFKDDILFQIFPETLSDNDFRSLNEELEIIEKAYCVTPDFIANLQNVKTFNGNSNSVQEFAMQREKKKYSNNFLIAILIANDIQMGYARMFQIIDDNPQISIKIFKDEAKAAKWIKSQNI